MGDSKIRDYVRNDGGAEARVYVHETPEGLLGGLSDEALLLQDRWRGTLSYLSSIGRWDHAIHIWDKKNVLYIEAGFIYAESDDNGLIMRTLVAMGINKTDRSFPIIIKEGHEYYEEALRNLINDTVDALVSGYGYSRVFQVYDAEKFERRFNGSCHMMLDEKGERLDSDYKVVEPNGSLIFSQVPAAVVDYLI